MTKIFQKFINLKHHLFLSYNSTCKRYKQKNLLIFYLSRYLKKLLPESKSFFTDEGLEVRLKTSSLELSSPRDSGPVPGGTSRSLPTPAEPPEADWLPPPVEPPPEVRIMSTASSTRSRRLSSVASKSKRWAGESSNNIPV